MKKYRNLVAVIVWLGSFCNVMFIFWLSGSDFHRGEDLAVSYVFSLFIAACVTAVVRGLIMED